MCDAGQGGDAGGEVAVQLPLVSAHDAGEQVRRAGGRAGEGDLGVAGQCGADLGQVLGGDGEPEQGSGADAEQTAVDVDVQVQDAAFEQLGHAPPDRGGRPT